MAKLRALFMTTSVAAAVIAAVGMSDGARAAPVDDLGRDANQALQQLTQANPLAASLARSGCATLAGRVDALPGDGPLWLGSYDQAGDSPALAGAAFTYDNALAIIALVWLCAKPRPTALHAG